MFVGLDGTATTTPDGLELDLHAIAPHAQDEDNEAREGHPADDGREKVEKAHPC